MKFRAALATLFLLVTVMAARATVAPGPYYARGTFYCSTALQGTGSASDSCYGYSSDLQLYDDGLHDDGAAGDSVYGCWVTTNQPAGTLEFKIANTDWTFNQPAVPAYPLLNALLFTSSPGEVIHFRLDLSTPAYGWLPAVAVSCDHGYPTGRRLELIGSAPELGNWAAGVPVDHIGSLWSKLVTIASPGTYQYKFRCEGTWAYAGFGLFYNNVQGDNGSFTTTAPNTDMVIQFDEVTGRIRAIPNQNVAVKHASWGQLKAVYR
jgi:hypothetical protein